MNNFWQKLNKPIYALAPMAGVADSAFRRMCKDFGADVVYSEMASATALFYNSKETLALLEFAKKERPYVVQLFGGHQEHFIKAAKMVEKKIRPDGFDINFGCPVPKVARQGAGAELMRDLKTSKKIVEALVKTAGVPVSIKIRAKAGKTDALRFLDNLKNLDIKAVMIHGRSLSQGHSGPVDFDIIKKARDYFGGAILANGGVDSPAAAVEMLKKTKADGVGIAQGALGRPWIFAELKGEKNKPNVFIIALKHAKLAEKIRGKQGIIEMRKHLCWYVRGLSGAAELRKRLVKAEKIDDIAVLKPFFSFKKQ